MSTHGPQTFVMPYAPFNSELPLADQLAWQDEWDAFDWVADELRRSPSGRAGGASPLSHASASQPKALIPNARIGR
jgi:hypothetical protein